MIKPELKTEIERLAQFKTSLGSMSDNPNEITISFPPGCGPAREMSKKLFSRYAVENATDDEENEVDVFKGIFHTEEMLEYFKLNCK